MSPLEKKKPTVLKQYRKVKYVLISGGREWWPAVCLWQACCFEVKGMATVLSLLIESTPAGH